MCVGAGEGGGRLAASMVDHGANVSCVNTNIFDLDGLINIPSSKKLLINISSGGSGKDPVFVKNAIKNDAIRNQIINFIKKQLETTPLFSECPHCKSKEKILDTEAVGDRHKCNECSESFGLTQIFKEEKTKHDYIFLFACLGGGSGSGLINSMIEICYSNFNIPIAVVCTIPDDEKDSTEKNNAVSVFKDLYNDYAVKGMVSPLILVDNQKMLEIFSHLPIGSMYKSINDYVCGFIHKFNTFSNKTSKYMTTIDTMDTARLWSLGGCCTIGKFTVGKSKVIDNNGQISVPHPLDFEGIEAAIKECVVMEGFDLSSAKGVGVIAVAPEYFLQDENISRAIKFTFAKVKEIIGDGVIFNGQYDDNKTDCLEFYIFFNGLKYPEQRFERLWGDIKQAKVISQKKKERMDEVSYEVNMESGSAGETFRRLQNSSMSAENSQMLQPEPQTKPRVVKKPCNNCHTANGISLGVYKKNGPIPFNGRICPSCKGSGKV